MQGDLRFDRSRRSVQRKIYPAVSVGIASHDRVPEGRTKTCIATAK